MIRLAGWLYGYLVGGAMQHAWIEVRWAFIHARRRGRDAWWGGGEGIDE